MARAKTRSTEPKKTPLTASTADKHELYERSVQDTSFDIRFIRRVYKNEHGTEPLVLREDFCGTAKLCADWVRSHPERRALGLDLHAPTLAWGKKRHIDPLGDAAARVSLLERNVMDGIDTKAEVAVAFNFSYCIFQKRQELLDYFRVVRRDLADGGLFFLDIHGGPDAQIETEETKKVTGGFTYVWEQRPMDALTARGVRYIHFRFRDGSEMKRAFTYDWRIWTLPEMRDLLLEAGFSRVDVYWEGDDGDGGGNGIFRKVVRAENEASWIAYVVAVR